MPVSRETHKKSAKRKHGSSGFETTQSTETDTSKPSAIFKPVKGRTHTLSIALPGSIIANAITHDQKTALAGQIARACAVFCVDEVVIFDDGTSSSKHMNHHGYTGLTDPNYFLYHLLSYLETPPQLRKRLFPIHDDLRSAGTLPSLDMPHHLRSDEWCTYREGLAVEPRQTNDGRSGTLIDCGLPQQVVIPTVLDQGTRVTVKLPEAQDDRARQWLEAEAVSPDTPREEAGYYWGYNVRLASSLSNIFSECPFDGGYNIGIGTSERGAPLSSLTENGTMCHSVWQNWQHLIIVFGGVAGLEAAFANDTQLLQSGVKAASELFDHWVNLVPGQGSRTIRTEEAVWIGLMGLKPLVDARNAI